jgi:uncharacterized membrane protein (UPF0127 family)
LGIIFIPSDIKNVNIAFSKGTIKIDEKLLTVEIADSDFERQRWLTFRNDKPNLDSGLILIYDKPDIYSMWLLNIIYPLDLMWFDQNGDIVYLKKMPNPVIIYLIHPIVHLRIQSRQNLYWLVHRDSSNTIT